MGGLPTRADRAPSLNLTPRPASENLHHAREAALKHGDRLTELVPDSGHLIHMATHIDVLCGDYQNVVTRNRKAAQIDRKYEALHGAKNFYTVYRIHNVHFEAYGAMFLGQPEVALAASETG
jgi:hypothetical protein